MYWCASLKSLASNIFDSIFRQFYNWWNAASFLSYEMCRFDMYLICVGLIVSLDNFITFGMLPRPYLTKCVGRGKALRLTQCVCQPPDYIKAGNAYKWKSCKQWVSQSF